MPERQVQAWQISAEPCLAAKRSIFGKTQVLPQKIGWFLFKLTNFRLTSVSRISAAIDSSQRHIMMHNGSLQIQNLRKLGHDEFAMLASC
jgi:hypothetical protein